MAQVQIHHRIDGKSDYPDKVGLFLFLVLPLVREIGEEIQVYSRMITVSLFYGAHELLLLQSLTDARRTQSQILDMSFDAILMISVIISFSSKLSLMRELKNVLGLSLSPTDWKTKLTALTYTKP